MYLLGNDTHHARTDNERYAGQFHIMKATEGKTFRDPIFINLINDVGIARSCPHLKGAYHFLSEKSGIEDQIDHFISTVEPLKGELLLALDYEGNFAKQDPSGTWLKNAVELFKAKTNGMQPVVYMNKSEAAKIRMKQKNLTEKTSLWLADYKGDYKGEWKPMMLQCCSAPFDIDVFYGSEGSWEAIAKSWK